MTRARELANFADNTAGLETLTVSDITDLTVSASNINSATNQITDSSTDLNVDSNTLVVDKSENKVGIGGSPSSDKLEIHSLASSNTNYGLKLKDSTVNVLGETVGIKFEWNTAVGAGVKAVLENVNNGAGGLSLETSGDGSSLTERVRIDSSGNVGIGTTAMNAVVNLYSATNTQIQFYTSTTGTGISNGARIGYNGSGAQIWNFENNYVRFATNDTERMRIDSNGNVHIADNTNGPDSALHIEKTTPQLRLQINGNSGYNTIESGSGNELVFGRSGTEQMRINSSGALIYSAGGYAATERKTNLTLTGGADILFNLWNNAKGRGQYLVSVTRAGASVATRALVIIASSSSSASYVYKVLDSSYLTVGVSNSSVTVTGSANQVVNAVAIPLAIDGN